MDRNNGAPPPPPHPSDHLDDTEDIIADLDDDMMITAYFGDLNAFFGSEQVMMMMMIDNPQATQFMECSHYVTPATTAVVNINHQSTSQSTRIEINHLASSQGAGSSQGPAGHSHGTSGLASGPSHGTSGLANRQVGASTSQAQRTGPLTPLKVKPYMFLTREDAAAALKVHRISLSKALEKFGWPKWIGVDGTHPMIKISAKVNDSHPHVFAIPRETNLQVLTETLYQRFKNKSFNLWYNFFGHYVPLRTEKQWLTCFLAYHVHRMPHIELVLLQNEGAPPPPPSHSIVFGGNGVIQQDASTETPLTEANLRLHMFKKQEVAAGELEVSEYVLTKATEYFRWPSWLGESGKRILFIHVTRTSARPDGLNIPKSANLLHLKKELEDSFTGLVRDTYDIIYHGQKIETDDAWRKCVQTFVETGNECMELSIHEWFFLIAS